ncbi:hypothetical protein CPAV1605_1424 [seawater metagenome]|uniref:TNase-like domain-containing protein n=1 Tax=seawater metagenome TaxID=1561972 RepID=A0A5E8CLA7_9ZZZZ
MGLCLSCAIYLSLRNKDSNIPLFDLKDKKFQAKVVDIYDGDTCHVVILFNMKWTKFKIRCLGYDTPEMKPPKDAKNRESLIDKAIKSRNYFLSRVTNCEIDINTHYTKKEVKQILLNNTKTIKLNCHGWDKYGRVLGKIYVNGTDINQEMIDKGYGYEYDGGTKKEFTI